MKRVLLAALALCLLLFACGQSLHAEITTTQPATTEPDVPEVEHTITQRIHPDMPEFTFTLFGESVAWGLFEVDAIEIIGEGFAQSIEKRTSTLWHNDVGFSLTDFNGDGYLDLQLHLFRGHAMRDEPSSLFWFWDSDTQQFVENEQLQELSKNERVSVADDGRVVGYFSAGGNIGRARTVYTYENGEFVQIERWSTANQFDGTWKTRFYERINGEMVLVRTEVETIE